MKYYNAIFEMLSYFENENKLHRNAPKASAKLVYLATPRACRAYGEEDLGPTPEGIISKRRHFANNPAQIKILDTSLGLGVLD